jgi:hypothetical protein
MVEDFRVLAPVGDETPTQGIERHHTGPMIAPDHQQVLAGRGVPSRRIIVNAAIARVQPVEDGEGIGALLWMTLSHMIDM